MQDFGDARPHAGAVAGGEDDSGEVCGQLMWIMPRACCG